ncbi:Uncharacterised protein r2_g3063 [Pycnogonum litorale]
MACRLDTGADVSAIPDRYLIKNSPLLKKTEKILLGPGKTPIKVLGTVTATLQTKVTTTKQNLYVVEDLTEALLGKEAIEALNLIKRVNNITATSKGIHERFPRLFKGLGKLKYRYKIRLKDETIPFSIATPRRLPIPMKEKVEEELKRLEIDDIIRPITSPTEWCAPIVAVPKKNGKVRLCVDFTKLNEGVMRENFPLPTTDQLLAQLGNAKIFSKLDCNNGFHQIPLAEKSQELTTFITPYGRFCYKRLPFGISSGPEVFQREMCHLLAGIPGVICDIDDVLVSGKDRVEHDQRLDEVLHKMKKAGITLNDKCVFSERKLKFLGHIISEKGIEIDPEKVTAIKDYPTPTNVHELRRLLGMVTHVGKFLKNLATVTEPLRELLKTDNSWTWDHPQEEAFCKIKALLTSSSLLSHYDSQLPTKVSADASSYGLGAVLCQRTGDVWKSVCYASRALTRTEQRYAQVEKEALAATWSCEKFAEFLVGLPKFLLETDHKPLLALLKTKRLDELTPRIQRLRMRLMRYAYDIIHVSGKNLVTADALSRATVGLPTASDINAEREVESFVNSIMLCLPASDKRLEEIRTKQNSDGVCTQVKEFCRTDNWPDLNKLTSSIKAYWHVRKNLTVEQDLLLYQRRIVIPLEMQRDILNKLHEGHQGILKCRALARESVWWPGLSTKIIDLIQACAICEKERYYHPQPLVTTKTPDYPWQKVGMDLFEYTNRKYLLIVDYLSRWIEVAQLRSTTSIAVIEHCKSIFARYGVPETVMSDNGPQFSSYEFRKFSQSYSFTHTTSSPYHPQGNGEAERAVRTVKTLLKKAEDPYAALLNYRASPLQQGVSPAEIMMGRKIRTKLPCTIKPAIPNAVKKFRLMDQQTKIKQEENFNKRHLAQPMEPLRPAQPVWIKDSSPVKATVVKNLTPRSVLVQTPLGELRRTRGAIRIQKEDQSTVNQPIQEEEATPPSENYSTEMTDGKTTTRSGRVVKEPRQLNL